MRYSKSRAPLVLMEQLVMVLVFALAAAVCIQSFVMTGIRSKKLVQKDHAMMVCESLAEIVKACHGDKNKILSETGGSLQEDRIQVSYDENWNRVPREDAVYMAVFQLQDTKSLCHRGTITVTAQENEDVLFSLDIAWQGEKNDA